MTTPSHPWIPGPQSPPLQAAPDPRTSAQACEAAGDLAGALAAYEAALAICPDDVEALAGLARLAGRMEMPQQALAWWEQVLAKEPSSLEAVDGRGRSLADLHRYGDAVEVLRAAILEHPHEARLWNCLGVVLNQQGDSAAALAFFDEAVRLEPHFAAALYNRGDVRFDLGELAYAEADFDAAARHAGSPGQTAAIAFARALLHLHRGDLGRGWDAYDARLDPDHPSAPVFEAPGAPWTPETPLDGAHLLAIAEQGLGDEIMFAGVLGDVLAALGPEGRLSVAVEPRLVDLLQRGLPAAAVCAHATERRAGRPHRSAPMLATELLAAERPVTLWAPLASLPRRFRRTPAAFEGAAAYLQPEPARVEHWRAWLGGRRAVGLSWRSGLLSGRRRRHYPELEAWSPVLKTAEVSFVNLQYGAMDEELASLEALGGAPVLRPPNLDLREDLDDLAALCTALDLVVSVPNATAALAAACGAPVWFLSGPAAWPRLGTQGYPWYPCTRSFAAERFGAWGPVMAAVASALRQA